MNYQQLREDVYLFCNDFYEYQASDQGQAVDNALKAYHYDRSDKNRKRLQDALGNYWDSRNYYENLTWADGEKRERARERDIEIAKYYCENY